MGNSDDLHLRRPEPIDQPERKPSQSKPTMIRLELGPSAWCSPNRKQAFFDLGKKFGAQP
jgi:hypothetical protein